MFQHRDMYHFNFLKAIIYLTKMRSNLASLIDIKFFIQMIYISFGLSSVRIEYILFIN